MKTIAAILSAVVLCGCVQGYQGDVKKSFFVDRYVDKDNGVVCYYVGGYYGRAISCVKVE